MRTGVGVEGRHAEWEEMCRERETSYRHYDNLIKIALLSSWSRSAGGNSDQIKIKIFLLQNFPFFFY